MPAEKTVSACAEKYRNINRVLRKNICMEREFSED